MTSWVLSLPDPKSGQARYTRIQRGMTEQEVLEVMGSQPDIALLGIGFSGLARYNPPDPGTPWTSLRWAFGDCAVTVELEESRVSRKEIDPSPPTVTDRLKALWPF